jgi:GT2 family glycosyltransferase
MIDYDAIVLDLDGDAGMVEQCLASIARQTVAPRRLLLVDNGSRVPSQERLAETHGAEIIRLQTNRGFAGGMNFALAQTTAPFVALINNDVVLEAAWASRLGERITSDPTIGAAQSILMNGDGTAIDGAGIALEAGRVAQLAHGEAIESLSLNRFWGVSATAALYRRQALVESARGGQVFDERFFAYFEDVDLAARLRSAGWLPSLLAEPLARHRGSASAANLGGHASFLRTRNRYYVARLNRGVLRIPSLLGEDARRVGGAVRRSDFGVAGEIVRAAMMGLFAPLPRI